MLKKVEKSFQNIYGCKKVNHEELFSQPLIMCFFPEDRNIKSMNGYLNKILYLLQIRHMNDTESDYDIDSIPFNLAINEEQDDFASQILSLIPENDINRSKAIMQNINLISYCYGNNVTGKVLIKIHDGLLKKGYMEIEAEEILSNIFVLQVVDNYVKDKVIESLPYATTLIIHNIHDGENMSYMNIDFKNNMPFLLGKKTKRSGILGLYKSFGEGSLSIRMDEHSFTDDYINSPILNAVMGIILINALSNKKQLIDSIKNKDIPSLTKLLEPLLTKAREYIINKKKKLDDYTKEDLKALTDYLMPIIQIEFKKHIKYQPLTDDDKKKKDEKTKLIDLYAKANGTTLQYLFSNLEFAIKELIETYNKYQEDDIIPINIGGNIPLMKNYTKHELMLEKINKIKEQVHVIIDKLHKLVMPEKLDQELIHEQRESVILLLNELKNRINNDQLQQILYEYNDSISIHM